MKYEEMITKFITRDFKTESSYKESKKKLKEKLENEKQLKLDKIEQLKKEISEIELAECKLYNL